jgi:hypothetical protein
MYPFAKTIFLEICHKPFKDGTPRHSLLSIELRDRSRDLAEEIINRLDSVYSESDGLSEWMEIHPCQEEIRMLFADLMGSLGIVGSIWVEYFFRMKNT